MSYWPWPWNGETVSSEAEERPGENNRAEVRVLDSNIEG